MASIKNILPSAAKSSIILVSLAILLLLNSPAICSSSSHHSYVLSSGHSLKAGGTLVRGKYNFTMQYDCNLVLYEGDVVIWSSHTALKGIRCSLLLKNNGELLVCKETGITVWRSEKRRKEGHYVLVVKLNGNVVVYGDDGDAVWSTGTFTSPPVIFGDKP